MPTALERRLARLERQRLAVMARLAAYSDAQRAFKPDPASWSLAGVVLHLILVEESLVRYGREQAATRPAWVRLRARLRERIVLAALGRDLRIKAPVPTIVPQAHLPLDELDSRWASARSDLQAYLAEVPPPQWRRTAFRHPRIGWVTAMGGLRIIEAHCGHHMRQVERILAADAFPR
ncbi:MAG: DinB family protein [Gemmatimonadales bacterium]